MAYNPLTGINTPDPVAPVTPTAYRPESGTTVSGYSNIGDYVNKSVAAMPQKKAPTKTPVYDAKGKLIGYNVTTYNADGSIAGTAFEAATAAPGAGKNSAYDLLLSQFSQYGLGSLVEPLKNLITDDTSEGELTLMLRNTESYKKRFAANADRLAKG